MRILTTFGNGHLPQFTGGVQTNTDFMMRSLVARRHEAMLLCSLFGEGLFGLWARTRLKLSGRLAVEDRRLGYRVARAWHPVEAVPQIVAAFRPDVALVQCHQSVPLGAALRAAGVPVVVYIHNVEFDELGGDPRSIPDATFIANSEFTRATYQNVFGIDTAVIYPVIEPDEYRTTGPRDAVTFINPVEKKGLRLALGMARKNPDIPFLFVESWTMTEEAEALLTGELATLPNVTFMRRTNDMRSVYARTKILIAPSRWEETWGRVASEAHCSGIPVIATNIGGLAEAVGPGGILIDREADEDAWSAELRRLWFGDALFATLSKAALDYARRPELDSATQMDHLVSILASAAQNSRDAEGSDQPVISGRR